MRKIVVAVILTLLFGIVTTAYAGVGACKHCYCPEFMDRGDGICDCGHGYGMHTEITKGLKAGQQIVTEIVVNTPDDDSEDQQQSQGLIGGPRPRGKKK